MQSRLVSNTVPCINIFIIWHLNNTFSIIGGVFNFIGGLSAVITPIVIGYLVLTLSFLMVGLEFPINNH